MSIWNRFDSALTAGVQAWRGAHQLPHYTSSGAWDAWGERLHRYQQHEHYYTNTQYSELNRMVARLKEAGRLYVNTRSIYNPIHRLVNLYADKVYPAMLDLYRLDRGAIPVIANDTVRASLIQLFRWSNWNAEKQLYVRTAEKYGDVFLRVVDDINSRRVVLEVVSPQKVQYVRKDSAGNIKEIWITYLEAEDDRPTLPGYHQENANVIRVTEIITGDGVQIFHDDIEVSSWDNPFGFVPVTHVKPTDEGFSYGAARWNISRSKIDEINSQAALLNDQVRKVTIPYIATIGGELPKGALNRSSTTMDEIINIAVGPGGDVKAIAPQIDIASALNNIRSQIDELREDNPELFLYQLTDMTVPPSGVALRQFFDLAVNKVLGAQGIYDDGLVRACQMALTIAGVQGYTNFPYTLQTFRNGDMNFSIRARDVIYDAVPETVRINYLMASGAPQSAIWSALGVSDDDQEQWRSEISVTQDDMAAVARRRVLEAGSGVPRMPDNSPIAE